MRGRRVLAKIMTVAFKFHCSKSDGKGLFVFNWTFKTQKSTA